MFRKISIAFLPIVSLILAIYVTNLTPQKMDHCAARELDCINWYKYGGWPLEFKLSPGGAVPSFPVKIYNYYTDIAFFFIIFLVSGIVAIVAYDNRKVLKKN